MKFPNRKLCDKTENLTHLYTDSKKQKNLEVFAKILSNSHTKTKYTITTYPNNIIFVTSTKKKKLTLTLTTTILTHMWKTRKKLQFDDTINRATNVIINIKNQLKTIILTHYKHHTIHNTLHEFQINFCISNALCKLTQNSITIYSKENTPQVLTYLCKQNSQVSTLCLQHLWSHKQKNLIKLFNNFSGP